jgi:hypothetical protein
MRQATDSMTFDNGPTRELGKSFDLDDRKMRGHGLEKMSPFSATTKNSASADRGYFPDFLMNLQSGRLDLNQRPLHPEGLQPANPRAVSPRFPCKNNIH